MLRVFANIQKNTNRKIFLMQNCYLLSYLTFNHNLKNGFIFKIIRFTDNVEKKIYHEKSHKDTYEYWYNQ